MEHGFVQRVSNDDEVRILRINTTPASEVYWGSAVPFTWGDNDNAEIEFSYEAA